MTDIEDLVERIEQIPGCALTKRRVLDALRSMAGRRIYVARRDVVIPGYVRLAGDLLDSHMTPAEAASALVERLTVSRRTAQRLVLRARQARAQRSVLRQLCIPWP